MLMFRWPGTRDGVRVIETIANYRAKETNDACTVRKTSELQPPRSGFVQQTRCSEPGDSASVAFSTSLAPGR